MNIMDYQVEKPKTKGLVIKKFIYDKEYREKHFSWTMPNL